MAEKDNAAISAVTGKTPEMRITTPGEDEMRMSVQMMDYARPIVDSSTQANLKSTLDSISAEGAKLRERYMQNAGSPQGTIDMLNKMAAKSNRFVNTAANAYPTGQPIGSIMYPRITSVADAYAASAQNAANASRQVVEKAAAKENAVASPYGEYGEELYNAVLKFGQEHPELQEKYPDFDSLANYYMEINGLNKNDEDVRRRQTADYLRRLLNRR